ncbi:alpha/beta hydrolase-fold protein [Spirillospora sp. CA-142024]|uniref:alpha/beta hydrolase-fold protein n=1 Tax=Spirillospora sp. CA-142024 TaxID=3240036 RepID=UPI003D9054B7
MKGNPVRISHRAALITLATTGLAMSVVSAATAGTPHGPAKNLSPQVVHTGTAPTGYKVTFRIYDPSATRMRIKGEWSFSSASDIAADPTNSNPRSPDQWKPGDVPLQSPVGPNANWPVADMVKDPATGVWSYTTPLPSGVFSYRLYRDCDAPAPDLTGCTPAADPSNPPWNTRGSVETSSQVYVPSDPRFGTADYSWQADAPPGRRGTLTDVSYPSALSTSPVGSHDLAVYLPHGYDPHRATPYPLFVLSHGGGGEQEVDWSTQGRQIQIIDNLIAAGKMQPVVVAMTNFMNLDGAEPGYASDVRNAVIPFMQQKYNVTTSASGRAFAGTSGGGTRANVMLFDNTTAFGYYGIWSAPRGLPAQGNPALANPDLKKLLGLQLAVGNQDVGGLAGPNMADEQSRLTAAGVPFETFKIDGGHTWYFWRKTLRDFMTKVAFRTTSTTVRATSTRAGVILKAKVTPATAEPEAPTGKVQFSVDGKAYGAPVPLSDGVARIVIPAHDAGSAYSGSYGGGQYYNASAGADS